jgi:protein TonB
MFESVLPGSALRGRPLGAGTLISAGVHLALALALLRHVALPTAEAPEVPVILKNPVRRSAPPPLAKKSDGKVVRHEARKRPARPRLVQPVEIPKEPIELPPAPAKAIEDDAPSEVKGVAGGRPGSAGDGAIDDDPGIEMGPIGVEAPPAPPARPERVDFQEGKMTRPVLRSGPELSYTERALEREIEGLLVARCVVTTAGAVRDCQVVKSLPYMDAAVVRTLELRRYSPALLDGQPVEVLYTFKINLRLPR